MNNFQNPYVDPASFQGKVYEYYRTPTNPHSIRSSLNIQGGVEPKETRQTQKNNQYDKTKKHPTYINNQLEKIADSKPVMFLPPKVDSIQKPLNEDSIDELAFNSAQSKNSENEKGNKKEVVSTLIKEFSQMLDDTPSGHEGFPTLQEGNFENESLISSDESTSIFVYTEHGNSEMHFDEFDFMLDERDDQLLSEEEIESLNKKNDTLEGKFFTMFSESGELQEEKQDIFMNEEEIESSNENSDTIEDKFFTMLSESDELQEEKQDSSFPNVKETKSEKIKELSKVEEVHFVQSNDNDLLVTENNSDEEFAFIPEKNNIEKEYNLDSKLDPSYFHSQEQNDTSKEEIHVCHKKPSFKKEKKRKYCINKNKPYNIASLKDVDYERFFQKNTHFIDLVEEKKTTVKMQVLLTKLETDIDIVETIGLLMPFENIVKVEWSIQSLDCKVVLPSDTVFLKGEFVAKIEFSNKGLDNKIQSLNVAIPWSKTTNINWMTAPEFPHSGQNEFMFQCQREQDSSFHYEAYYKFAEPIHSRLNQINFVWYQELNSKDDYLQVNGVAQLSIHFIQEQFIELDCYSK